MCTHTAAFQCEGRKQRNEKRRKDEGEYDWPAPVYVESVYASLAVNMKEKKKPRRPSEKLTPEPVNKPLAKFINVKQGIVFPLRRRENKKQKGQHH